MINKISGWENLEAKETSDFKSLPVGNYIVRVKSIENVPTKEYIKVCFDIADGEYKDYFTKLANVNNGIWNNQGIKYASYKETAVEFFRQFITALEKSNQGYVWDWDENKWVGKLFVAVFGEEEYYNTDGELKVGVKLRECRSIEALKKGEIKPVGLKKVKQPKANPIADTTFQDIEGNLPF